MATIRKHRDKWQAQIRLSGIKPIARSFTKRSDAIAWACVTEGKVTLGTYVNPRAAESTMLSEVIDRYIEQCKSQFKESRSDSSRLKRLRIDLGAFSLNKIDWCQLSEYRDRRLLEANPATVSHELSLLTRILRRANSDWGIPLPQGVPHVRQPKMPQGRIRRMSTTEEIDLLEKSKDDEELRNIILLALETAMRRSEIIGMRWCDIDWKASTLNIPKTKAGVPRVIPLTGAAIALLRGVVEKGEYIWKISATAASQRFARACGRAAIQGLRFHDLRHEAISRLFELGLNQMEVAAISGHKTVAMLQRYTHINPSHLVARLEKLQEGNGKHSIAN